MEGEDASDWRRDVLYLGESLQPGTRVKHFHVTITFQEGVLPKPNDVVFNLELRGDQIRWPRNGLDKIRLDLPANIYSRVLALAQDGKQDRMIVDVTVETESGRQMSLYYDFLGQRYYGSMVELIKDHTQRVHWLGMDSMAVKIFRGPRRAMFAERAKYAYRKCSEIWEYRRASLKHLNQH